MAPVATPSAAAWHSPAGQRNNLFMTDTWDMHCVTMSTYCNSTAWDSRMQRKECKASLRVTCCTSSAADGLSAGLGCSILSITERRMGRCPSRASCLTSALFLGSFSPAHAHQQHDLTVSQPLVTTCPAASQSSGGYSSMQQQGALPAMEHDRRMYASCWPFLPGVRGAPVAHSYRVAPRLKMSAAVVGAASWRSSGAR